MGGREKNRHFVCRQTVSSFPVCDVLENSRTPASDYFPYCVAYLKSDQGCIAPNSKWSSGFSKPDYRCEHPMRGNCPFMTFFFQHPHYCLHYLGVSSAFHLPCLKKGLCAIECSSTASSGGTGILRCFLLKVVIFCIGMSVHPIFSSV